MGIGHVIIGTADGVKAQNAEWFASDLLGATIVDDATSAVTYQCTIELTTSVICQYTRDSGTNWVPFNGGFAFQNGTFDITGVTNGDLINIRTTDAAGTTVLTCVLENKV